MLLWLLACRPGDFDAAYVPSPYVPAAGKVEWTGPSGHATLYADGGVFAARRVVSEADVEAGRSSLPLALLPGGSWKWWVEVDDGRDVVESRAGTVDVPDPPDGAGDPRLADVDDERSQLASGGFWVGYHFGFKDSPDDAVPMIVDGDGEIVWWLPPSDEGFRTMRVRPAANGRDVLVLDDHPDGSLRRLTRFALDGSAATVTAMPDASHDFWENGDGTFTYDAYVFSDTELVPGQPGPAAADEIRTVPEGAADLSAATLGFDFFDDFPRDPWWTCPHANYDGFVPDAAEWTHVNSILRSPLGDGYMLQVRFLDAVMLVDGHERKWQAGGIDSTLVPASDDALFEHGHSSDAWLDPADGLVHQLVFDNGDHSPPPIVSRVVELALDPDHGRWSAVWQLADPEAEFDNFLGDARRLPNGDTLVTWTDRGELVEYTPDGEAVWTLSVDGALGRGFWVPAVDLAGP